MGLFSMEQTGSRICLDEVSGADSGSARVIRLVRQLATNSGEVLANFVGKRERLP